MNWQQSLNGFPLPHGQSPAVSKYATLCTSVADLALYNETLLHGKGYLGDGRTCATCWDRWRGSPTSHTCSSVRPETRKTEVVPSGAGKNALYFTVLLEYLIWVLS